MGLYRVHGNVARIAGKPFNDPSCCYVCTPVCCCPPPDPLPARIDADEFAAPVAFDLSQVPSQPGECRRYYGEVDLTGEGLPSCRLFKVLVIWPENCNDISQVEVYTELGEEGYSLLTKDIATCTPFCIQGVPPLINCGTNTLLTLGCVLPPECCCPPPDPLYAKFTCSIGTLAGEEAVFEMTEVAYQSGECRRYEGSTDLSTLDPSCGLLEARLIWPEGCTTIDEVQSWYRYDGGPWTQTPAVHETCDPFCMRSGLFSFTCCDGAEIEYGCNVEPCYCPPVDPLWAEFKCGGVTLGKIQLTEQTPDVGECRQWKGEATLGACGECGVILRWLYPGTTWSDIEVFIKVEGGDYDLLENTDGDCSPFCISGEYTPGTDCCGGELMEVDIGCDVTPPWPCCCPPDDPDNLYAKLDCPEPVWGPVYMPLTEVAAQTGECKRFEGSYDLSTIDPTWCKQLDLRVIWPDGCTNFSEVIVEYNYDGSGWTPIDLSLSSTCDPLCLITNIALASSCCEDIGIEIGCGHVPPPSCCCDPPEPLSGGVCYAESPFEQVSVMIDQTPGPGECRRMSSTYTIGSCSAEVQLRWASGCSDINGVTAWIVYDSTEVQLTPDTSDPQYTNCSPFAWASQPIDLPACGATGVCFWTNVKSPLCTGCSGGPGPVFDRVAGATPPAPSREIARPPTPPTPRTPQPPPIMADLDDLVDDILDDTTPELEEWQRRISGE